MTRGSCGGADVGLARFTTGETSIEVYVIVIDLFNETVLFNHRGGRNPPRLLNRQSS